MKIFGERAPREEAKAFAHRRINDQCSRIREGADWRDRFALCPVTVPHQHGGYAVRAWAIRLDSAEGRLIRVIIHNFGRTQLQFRKPFGVWKNCVDEPAP